MDVLVNQLLNQKLTGKWLFNTGDLRQIGKTTAIVKVAEMFVEQNENELTKLGVLPRYNIYVVVPNVVAANRVQKLTKANVIAVSDLERFASLKDNLVLLFDEMSQADLNVACRFLNDSLNEDKIKFKAGWYHN